MNFGEQIKRIRKERNLTQQEMADKLNISRQAVSNWENDKNLPDIEMLIQMSQVFHLTLDELILGGTQMNNLTEKLIKDTSTNNRIRMNLYGIIIGSVLMVLGLISLVIGILVPPEMENYWSTAFSILMLGGLISFMVIGIKSIIDLFRNREEKAVKNKKLLATGGIIIVLSVILFGISMLTNKLSGLVGIVGIILGIIITIIAVIKSAK